MQAFHNSVAARGAQAPRGRNSQSGFTLIELTVVFLILVVLAVIAVPRIQALIIENKTPTVARELQAAVTRMRGSRASAGVTPYAGIAVAELGAMLRNTSFTIDGPPATAVTHALGAGTAATVPSVTIGAVDVGAGAGSGFTLLFQDVDQAGCGPLVSTLAGASEAIQIGGGASIATTGAGANAKATGGPFLPGPAQTACGAAPASNIAFVFR